jgi:hypothetical protein
MERPGWLGIAIVLVAVGSACSAQGPLVRDANSPSPTPSTVALSPQPSPSSEPPTPSAEPTPVPLSLSCSTTPSAASEPLVIGATPARQQLVLESLHDPAHPTTLCTIDGAYNVRFISGTEIGYVTNSSLNNPIEGTSAIMRMSLTDLKPVAVASVQGEVMDLAWSPDGSSVAYLVYTYAPGLGSGDANQLWQKTGNAPPRALTPLIPLFGRGGSISDQILVRFSPDGKYLLMVDTYVDGPAPVSPDQAHFQVRAMPVGNLVWVPPTALGSGDKIGFSFVTMAAWARTADRLYYRDLAGVHTWDPPSTVGTMAGGLAWFSPSVSPDDRFVAYTVNLDTQPHVEVRDLVSNALRVLPGIRAAPFFVSSGTLLEGAYAPSNQQGPGTLPYAQTGSVVFNLGTNVETPIPVVINPIDIWPR